jgi:hypothetical protein
MGLAWRQGNSQFQARQVTLNLDKDYKDLDEEVTEDPHQTDRVEHHMDIKRTGLQNANDTLTTAMFESFEGTPEFDFIHSLSYFVTVSHLTTVHSWIQILIIDTYNLLAYSSVSLTDQKGKKVFFDLVRDLDIFSLLTLFFLSFSFKYFF